MFACFAQMRRVVNSCYNGSRPWFLIVLLRICHLLETWIQSYPYDFAVKGAAGALSALIKSMLSKTYLLQYGSQLLPFLEVVPSLVDKDSLWSCKEENGIDEESSEEEEDEEVEQATTSLKRSVVEENGESKADPTSSSAMLLPQAQRVDQKGSFPLFTKVMQHQSFVSAASGKRFELSTKELLKGLREVAAEVNSRNPEEIAQEITRWESELFLAIEVSQLLSSSFLASRS